MSSDTWPGTGGVLGLTKAQIAAAKAEGVKPAGGAGFAYMQGPDNAIIEYQGNMPAERFNHVHLYQEDPFCAQLWYQKHLGGTAVASRVARPGAHRGELQGRAQPRPHLAGAREAGHVPGAHRRGHLRRCCTHLVREPGRYAARDQPRTALRPHRAQRVRSRCLGRKAPGRGRNFLEAPYKLGDTRAAMIEGPSREAIELVEVR